MQADLEASGFAKNQPVNITPTEQEKPGSRLREAIGLSEEDAGEAAKNIKKELAQEKED